MRDICASYGDHIALDQVSLAVPRGQIVAVLGPNGAGKSTLISIIAGLRSPTSGTLSFDGTDLLSSTRRSHARIGIAPQETGIYRTLTVGENLGFFAELAGVPKNDRTQRTRDVAASLGLTELFDRRSARLSGGEARRLHTACALVGDPELVLLDEPTVGADIETRAQLIDTVTQLSHSGAAVLYTTHYLPEVERLDATVVIIDQGRVVACGTIDQLVAEHHLEGIEMRFHGEAPTLDPTPLGTNLRHEISDSGLRIFGSVDIQVALALVGDRQTDIMSIEVIRPDLEAVFLKLTGRRFDEEEPPAETARRRLDHRGGTPMTGAVMLMRNQFRILRRDPMFLVIMAGMPIIVSPMLKRSAAAALAISGNDGTSGAEQVVPGGAVMFAFFVAGSLPFQVFKEHGWHTWERVRASGVSGPDLAIGFSVPWVIITALYQVVVMAVGVVTMDFDPWESLLPITILIVCYSCALVSIAALVTTMFQSIQTVQGIVNLGATVFGSIGGSLVPVDSLPGWAQAIAPATPAYWAMRGYRSVLIDGGGLDSIVLPCAVLLGVTAAFGLAAGYRFRVDEPKEFFA